MTSLKRDVYRVLALTAMCVAALASTRIAFANEAFLSLTFGDRTVRLSRTELLSSPGLRVIDVPASAGYRRPMRYQAIPLARLIPKPPSESVQFKASDGFVANIPSGLLYGPSQPWLAIESPQTPWPPLGRDGQSAGPFFLVWLMPEKVGISPEQWPYRIISISEAPALEKRFPALLPKSRANSPEQRGLRVFVANCSVCHKLNGAGDAAVGPDLNDPYNPTEYFQEAFLRKLIRAPASVRDWGQRIMPGFSPAALTDAQLDDLLAYLRQMARQRLAKP
jgi:mono/diheme cytochrome c family protein